jgi:hypothetical protein
MQEEHVEEAGEQAPEPRPELVASTLEALQSRVERADREALRGAIGYHPPADLSGWGEDMAR